MSTDAGKEFEAINAVRGLVTDKRNESALIDIQRRKMEARDRLVAARAEMRQLDAELIESGGNGLDLVMVCW